MISGSLRQGQRVRVNSVGGIAVNALGTVARVRIGDDGVWVALDRRSKVSAVHPFPDEDCARRRNVLVYPDDCDLPETNGKERRTAAREAARPPQEQPTVDVFGCDHWSTFAYIETLCVEAGPSGGSPHLPRMRCDDGRHPYYSHRHDASDCPTRLKGGVLLKGHDDWDCAGDLVAAGLLESVGTGANPAFRLTPEGQRVASLLRVWKQQGGSFATFEPGVALSRVQEKRQ